MNIALVEVRRIDAARQIVENLSKNPNVTYIPSGINPLLNMRGI